MNSTDHEEWSSDLFDCFSDWRSCCLTFWCPCISFGRIAEIVDQENTSLFCLLGSLTSLATTLASGHNSSLGQCCLMFYTSPYRTKLRKRFKLEASPCNDYLVHLFCLSCALCQEYRELQRRGFDMSIGWDGNVERQNPEVAIASSAVPSVESGMTRESGSLLK